MCRPKQISDVSCHAEYILFQPIFIGGEGGGGGGGGNELAILNHFRTEDVLH